MPRMLPLLLIVCCSIRLCTGVEPLLSSSARWLQYLSQGRRLDDAVKRTYLRFLMTMLSGLTFSCDFTAPLNSLSYCMEPYREGGVGVRSEKLRYGITMAGHARMDSLVAMIEKVSVDGPSGSYLEAGVWRGGMSIIATAALQIYGIPRPVYICDSYDGLPRPRENSARVDEKFYHDDRVYKRVLSVGEQEVLANFDLFGVSRANVVPVKGYFVNSLPPLRDDLQRRQEKLAILRMDGDMYDSTVDILYNLYDLVNVGGYIIIDDYAWGWGVANGEHDKQNSPSQGLYGAKDALLDFRQLHGIEDDAHAIHDIDGGGAWFRKMREVKVKRDRYQSVLANTTTMRDALVPHPRRTRGQVHALQARWREMDNGQRQTSWRQSLKVYEGLKAGRPPINRSNWREVIAEAPADVPWHM